MFIIRLFTIFWMAYISQASCVGFFWLILFLVSSVLDFMFSWSTLHSTENTLTCPYLCFYLCFLLWMLSVAFFVMGELGWYQHSCKAKTESTYTVVCFSNLLLCSKTSKSTSNTVKSCQWSKWQYHPNKEMLANQRSTNTNAGDKSVRS